MPSVPFTKASACGNDFLIIEAQHAPADINDFSRRICDRHNGVGADGVEWLLTPAQASAAAETHAAAIRLINADGSEAEISGNGTRCVAAYLVAVAANNDISAAASRARAAKNKLAIRTGAGIKHCELISRSGNTFEFEMDMGRPQVGQQFALKLSAAEVTGTPLSMGNPQFVVFVDQFPANWQALAAEIQRQSNFEEGVNVDFVRVLGKNEIESRFFERGAGYTQSSGTGSCASAVAAISAGRAQSPLTVRAEGGAQTVRWSGENESVFLRGPAQLICRGEYCTGDARA